VLVLCLVSVLYSLILVLCVAGGWLRFGFQCSAWFSARGAVCYGSAFPTLRSLQTRHTVPFSWLWPIVRPVPVLRSRLCVAFF
jgi:hypothetical protein